MKLTQKLLCAILALVMVVCILPLSASAAEKTYVLDAKAHLSPMPEKTKADGDTEVVGPDGYFTIHFSEKTKIDESEKTFEDGYESNQRLNFAGKAQVKPNGTTKNVVEFTTEGPATVKILAPTPRISPSLLASMAGDTTALAKPVMGTRVPAPANLAMRSKTPRPVRMAATSTRVAAVRVPASSLGRWQSLV